MVLLAMEAVGIGVGGAGMAAAEGMEAGWGGMAAATEEEEGAGMVVATEEEGAGMDTGTVVIIDPDEAVVARGGV